MPAPTADQRPRRATGKVTRPTRPTLPNRPTGLLGLAGPTGLLGLAGLALGAATTAPPLVATTTTRGVSLRGTVWWAI
ncbi:hypothetical protein SAMN05216482_5931 [Streptomyces sp. PAN_FS17]|nr:hypothetical protein SAMN05216482_5931 [Streptomyces sp. PAN_FS17]